MSLVTNQTSASTAGGNPDAVHGAVKISDAAQMENNFITLMVAQIRNQDPTAPVDSTQFLNQFSAMSQVKSLENMTKLSQSNLVLLDNLQTLVASSLVNQEVRVATDKVQLDGSTPIKGGLELAHASGSTLLRLTDALGRQTELNLGNQRPGKVAFEIDPIALGLSAGSYRIEAVTDSGEYPTVEIAGRVGKVRVGDEGPVLDIAGVGMVPFYTLTEFNGLL